MRALRTAPASITTTIASIASRVAWGGATVTGRTLGRTMVTLALGWSLSVDPVSAHPAWGVIAAPDGTVYFADVNRNVVWKIGQDGRLRTVVQDRHSHAIRLDVDGSIVGEHVVYDEPGGRSIRTLWRLLPDGQVSEIPMDSVGPSAARAGTDLVWLETADQPERRIRLMVTPADGPTRVLADRSRAAMTARRSDIMARNGRAGMSGRFGRQPAGCDPVYNGISSEPLRGLRTSPWPGAPRGSPSAT